MLDDKTLLLRAQIRCPAGMPLHGAEYFIDKDPGLGKGIPFNALDGSFDSCLEVVEATIDISSWESGSTHQIYVRGTDNVIWDETMKIQVGKEKAALQIVKEAVTSYWWVFPMILMGFLLGFLFLQRPRDNCPNCEARVDLSGMSFCTNCGRELHEGDSEVDQRKEEEGESKDELDELQDIIDEMNGNGVVEEDEEDKIIPW